LLAVVGSTVVSVSQTQSPSERTGFEVASIRSNPSGGAAYIYPLPGRLRLTNFSLRRLILSAYSVEDYQISGDPPWISSHYYDIEAKADGDASVKEMEGPMLRALLEDRFKLMLHRETRQLPVYELRAIKDGVKLRASKQGACFPYSMDSPPPPALAPGAPRPTYCGYPRFGVGGLNRSLEGAEISMAQLATSLSRTGLRRAVIDKSGATGTFDIHLNWTVDDAQTGFASPGASDDRRAPSPTASLAGPSIFTALREQLGLTLKSTKGPVEVLVIDHIEEPSEN
jgi:uncharacterized protein (TIGR03435 family)